MGMSTSVFRGAAASIDLADAAYALSGAPTDYDPLLDLIGNSTCVLLGEASHGTHEFYKARAEITKRLILEKDFNLIAWESDWPDALRINRYVRNTSSRDHSALEALGDYKRFPRWMWRNADILDLIGWIKAHNEKRADKQVGVYGLDLYSLHSSMDAVIRYLEKVDPKSAQAARRRYSCFEEFGEDPQSYGLTASVHPSLSCEDEVVAQLVDLQQHASDFLRRDGRIAEDELFYAEQNARVAKGAEQYYRAMYYGRPNTWNLRDTHMADTLDSLMQHLRAHREKPKAIVWAHNSHLGDARHTQMGKRGELNIGQLVRERHPRASISVGFTTFTGTVTAASDWDEPADRKHVRPGMEGSYELLFHDLEIPRFLLIPREDQEVYDFLSRPLLERAIGVIYRPESERYSHYFSAEFARQFDAIIHFDETRAIEPLDRTALWEKGELPETFPSGY
jgi:erythromycin esterase-like protein